MGIASYWQEDALTDASDSEASERGEDDDGDAAEEGTEKAAKKPAKKAVLKFSLGSAKKGAKADKARLLGSGRLENLVAVSHELCLT